MDVSADSKARSSLQGEAQLRYQIKKKILADSFLPTSPYIYMTKDAYCNHVKEEMIPMS